MKTVLSYGSAQGAEKENSIRLKPLEAKQQYEEWVARFCYASAQLPVPTVERFLELMEACSESETILNRQELGRG